MLVTSFVLGFLYRSLFCSPGSSSLGVVDSPNHVRSPPASRLPIQQIPISPLGPTRLSTILISHFENGSHWMARNHP
jgi:hypothetical protein